MKFVILTDTHFVPRGRKLYGLDPAERLAVAVETINATHRDISFVIVTGDLAHWGEQAAYASLAGVLGALDAPTVLMMGNHDKREAFPGQRQRRGLADAAAAAGYQSHLAVRSHAPSPRDLSRQISRGAR